MKRFQSKLVPKKVVPPKVILLRRRRVREEFLRAFPKPRSQREEVLQEKIRSWAARGKVDFQRYDDLLYEFLGQITSAFPKFDQVERDLALFEQLVMWLRIEQRFKRKLSSDDLLLSLHSVVFGYLQLIARLKEWRLSDLIIRPEP